MISQILKTVSHNNFKQKLKGYYEAKPFKNLSREELSSLVSSVTSATVSRRPKSRKEWKAFIKENARNADGSLNLEPLIEIHQRDKNSPRWLKEFFFTAIEEINPDTDKALVEKINAFIKELRVKGDFSSAVLTTPTDKVSSTFRAIADKKRNQDPEDYFIWTLVRYLIEARVDGEAPERIIKSVSDWKRAITQGLDKEGQSASLSTLAQQRDHLQPSPCDDSVNFSNAVLEIVAERGGQKLIDRIDAQLQKVEVEGGFNSQNLLGRFTKDWAIVRMEHSIRENIDDSEQLLLLHLVKELIRNKYEQTRVQDWGQELRGSGVIDEDNKINPKALAFYHQSKVIGNRWNEDYYGFCDAVLKLIYQEQDEELFQAFYKMKSRVYELAGYADLVAATAINPEVAPALIRKVGDLKDNRIEVKHKTHRTHLEICMLDLVRREVYNRRQEVSSNVLKQEQNLWKFCSSRSNLRPSIAFLSRIIRITKDSQKDALYNAILNFAYGSASIDIKGFDASEILISINAFMQDLFKKEGLSFNPLSLQINLEDKQRLLAKIGSLRRANTAREIVRRELAKALIRRAEEPAEGVNPKGKVA